MVAYNPQHIVPPDNINATWCDLCGEQVMADEDAAYLLDGVIVHFGCLPEYAEGLQLRLRGLENKISDLVERGLS